MPSLDLASLLSKTSIADGDPEKEIPLPSRATQLSESSSNDGDPAVTELSMSEVYEIQSIKGKGKGLIALRDIERGTRLLCEPPLLTTEGISSADQVEMPIQSRTAAIPFPSQQFPWKESIFRHCQDQRPTFRFRFAHWRNLPHHKPNQSQLSPKHPTHLELFNKTRNNSCY